MFSCLINDKTSLKQQLLVSYSLITIISAGITLGICYGLLYSLKNSASIAATENLLNQTDSNARALAIEIANAINQEITIVGESICMVGARYASILLSNSHKGKLGGTILKKKPSYREYYLDGPCLDPKHCPSDYGALLGRSRLPPHLPGFINGSLVHSSVYLFSSNASRAARTNQTWINVMKESPAVNSVINGLAYHDRDMNIMYTKGPNTTVMFYLSTKISLSSSSYVAVHRTFPGIVKNSTTYNPPTRPWFKNAPQDSYNVYGPYVETFTRQRVVTLSTLSTATDAATNQTLSTVAAGVMLIDTLSSIVNRVQYTNGGFGVLFDKITQSVLVWKDESYNTLKSDNKTFKTVMDFDLQLAAKPITSSEPFEYRDEHGVTWIVSPYPFFQPGKANDPSSSGNRLVILVFAQKSQATAVLDSLNSNINSTTNGVVTVTIIVIAITVAATILLCFLVIEYIAHPLEAMRQISEDITRMSAEDEDKRDYRDVIRKALVNLTRTDEVGILAIDYYSIVCLLHNRSMAKRNSPKYPPNPFHFGPNVDHSQLTWPQFVQICKSENPLPSSCAPTSNEPNTDFDLNVLGSLNNLTADTTIHFANASYSRISSVFPAELVSVVGEEEKGITESFVEVPAEVVEVGLFTSLKSQLYMLSAVLLAGVAVTMIITVVALSRQGVTWMSTSSVDIDDVQVLNMQAMTYAKSVYVEAYYQQLSTDVLTAAAYLTDLFNQNLTDATWYSDGNYLPSYSLNYYDEHRKIENTKEHSLYYATDYAFCNITRNCDKLYKSNLTTLSSLSDMKLRSYFHNFSFVEFLQFGMEQNGFTRYLPFTGNSIATDNPSNPASCRIDLPTSDSSCLAKYYSSKCSGASNSYPSYDPRCRQWYYNGKDSEDYQTVSFQEPRSSSAGSFVQTAYIPLRKNGQFAGVLISNYLAARLSTVINSNTILQSGYCYLIESNSSTLISHPKITSSCRDISCVEGFSSSEYADFQKHVLNPVRLSGRLPASSASVNFMKQGRQWRIIASKVEFENIHYTVFATVPTSEVEKTSTDTTDAINRTVDVMIYVFSACILSLLLVLVLYSWLMISLIVNPINDLRAAFTLIRSDDLNSEVPTKASSRDLKILLGAFGQLLVALRFGSESYGKGDPLKARSSFSDALNLFTMAGNKKGVGSSQNNLSAAELALGNDAEAEAHSKLAIRNAEELLQELITAPVSTAVSPDDRRDAINRARRVLSDRKGNLVIIYLQQDRFGDAFELIEKLLAEDKESLYIRGLVVKQGTLGHYYLKQGEIGSAECVFGDALRFIQRRDESMFSSEWNSEEAESAEQIALFNMCALLKAKKESRMETHYLRALCSTTTMHTATVTMIFTALKEQLVSENRKEDAAVLDSIAAQHNFALDTLRARKAGPKRVAFVIDYSGSMSGSKIRSAIENVQNIFQDHIQGHDSIMVMTFNGQVNKDIPMSLKSGKEQSISSKIATLNSPNGGTAFYSAIDMCLQHLQGTLRGTNDWIVTLTDGNDNCSAHITAATVKSKLRSARVGLVIIGIGNDVKAEVLRGIADSAAENKGTYLFARGDKKSIDEAFGEVAAILSGGTFITEEL